VARTAGRHQIISGYWQEIIPKFDQTAPMHHLTTEQLEAGLDSIRESPVDSGILEMIVRRPRADEREVLSVAELSVGEGLIGDDWVNRPSSRTDDGGPHPDMQITVINSRLLRLIAIDPERMVLAGDQLTADLDLSVDNLPPGTRMAIGDAVLEVTAEPHTGCKKFNARFGVDALRFVNSPVGRSLRLRGLNARVVEPGVIRAGDRFVKAGSATP